MLNRYSPLPLADVAGFRMYRHRGSRYWYVNMNCVGGGITCTWCRCARIKCTSSVEIGRIVVTLNTSESGVMAAKFSSDGVVVAPALDAVAVVVFLRGAGRLCVFHLPSNSSRSFKHVRSNSFIFICSTFCNWMYRMCSSTFRTTSSNVTTIRMRVSQLLMNATIVLWSDLSMSLPFIDRMTSPSRIPLRCAGPPYST